MAIVLKRYGRVLAGIFMILSLLVGLFPREASAHAALINTEPAPNSRMEQGPEQIRLTFNEALEESVFYIHVLDQSGNKITDEEASMTQDRSAIVLKLPKLGEGLYLVSYHVISGDGHPVGGSYPITVGDPPASGDSAAGEAPHEHGIGSSGVDGLLQFIARGFWYAAMLSLTGWLFWRRTASIRKLPEAVSSKWTRMLQLFYLITLLFVVATHLESLLGGGGLSQLGNLLTRTGIGISWLVSLALSLLGFMLLTRRAWLDYAWAAALLLTKSLSGHAVTFSPEWASVLSDAVHLAASALWVGGLIAAWVLYTKKRDEFTGFLKAFSKAALGSIVVLAVSGSVLVLLFLPDLTYIFDTQWGILLLIKLGLVLVVAGTGALLRYYMKKNNEQAVRSLYKVDFSAMLLILLAVGFLTYLSPAPPNQPLNWHEMGKTAHMTAVVTPNAPGTNSFAVTVWLPENTGAPKHVQMNVQYQPAAGDDSALAPIQIPLELQSGSKNEMKIADFTAYSYTAQGPFLPLPGNCVLEVRIMDSNDDETVFKKEMKLY
ncbi:copper resistance CopC/CopD family protein [Paenibacillus sp. FJAT-26967]|uniref:copper resistance CopC/CopD family protein n=1 Tax=Paenibacillus sp. FJAT-26967 TaxID=1729690 RepID=UPI000AFD467B|nr:copper resistance protein CopC [Paenibacillus sp. FJAT-26967]